MPGASMPKARTTGCARPGRQGAVEAGCRCSCRPHAVRPSPPPLLSLHATAGGGHMCFFSVSRALTITLSSFPLLLVVTHTLTYPPCRATRWLPSRAPPAPTACASAKSRLDCLWTRCAGSGGRPRPCPRALTPRPLRPRRWRREPGSWTAPTPASTLRRPKRWHTAPWPCTAGASAWGRTWSRLPTPQTPRPTLTPLPSLASTPAPTRCV